MRLVCLLSLFASLAVVYSQSSDNSSSSSSSTSLSLSETTSSVVITTSTRRNGENTQFTTVVPTTFNVTYTPTPTSSASATSTSSAASQSSSPIVLETKLDPAFGVLGAVLILTGLPSAFLGHKNRWTSFFLMGFYTLSLVCFVLILKFGILPAVNPPNKTLRGMFVLSSAIAGIVGGALSIFFWKAARYCIGGWGGLAFALWIQCFRNGGLIHPVGYRWILYIGCAVVGFVLCTLPKIHYHILLISTAIVGSSAFMLGVDCFTTAGLKEFYVWNLGFTSLFPKYTSNGIQFPVSQTMQIELGLIGAVTLIGAAVQLRILRVLQQKLEEIAQEQRKRDEEAEGAASSRFAALVRDREEWEKEHGGKHGRQESNYSHMPLMKDHDGSHSPSTPDHQGSGFTMANGRSRHQSGVSDFFAAPASEDDVKRAVRGMQTPGALPALDLGLGIKDDVPKNFIAEPDSPDKKDMTHSELDDLRRKEELVSEIQTLRKSLEVLRSESPGLSSGSDTRRPSLTSHRTLSMDATAALLPTREHLRPPREKDPRARVRSMELSTFGNQTTGESISRPTSAPLRDVDWDAYVQERKLLQPPSGISQPIATTSPSTPISKIQMPPAVADALQQRKRRESALGFGEESSSDDIPLSKISRPERRNSTGGNVPFNILPPKKQEAHIAAPTPRRPITKTFEELNERHREKMRDMQGPITTAQKEQAELEAAKQRWEKAKAVEREAVTRRQAEKAAAIDKRKRSHEEQRERHGRNAERSERDRPRHSRSLSADKLATLGTSSKRLSTMKVEDWQRYQQEINTGTRRDEGSRANRDSRALPPGSGVPFPEGSHRRRSRDNLA